MGSSDILIQTKLSIIKATRTEPHGLEVNVYDCSDMQLSVGACTVHAWCGGELIKRIVVMDWELQLPDRHISEVQQRLILNPGVRP